jgi:large subunit ribosomal protein L20
MRVKSGTVTKRRHKKVLDSVKGHRLARSKHYKVAKEDALHAGQYAFIGRKHRKRDFRRLWITRINAGLSQIEGAPRYSAFMNLMTQKQVTINRKMLALMAVEDFDGFAKVVRFIYGK